jgi:hypothetical protein
VSVAWYIALDREISGKNHFLEGKALAHASKAIDGLAARAGVPPLMSFFGASSAELSEFAAAHSKEIGEEQWFSADEGLMTGRVLLREAVACGLDERVIDDLKEFVRVFETAVQVGARWHLAVDF